MKTGIKRALTLLLVFACLLTGGIAAFAQTPAQALDDVLNYIAATVTAPIVNSVGGEWAILALARGGASVPGGYYAGYANTVKQTLRGNGGILPSSATRKTEYSRVVIALSALGEDVTNFDGRNLLLPLANISDVTAQGLNGAVYALLAFDALRLDIPTIANTALQTTRRKLVDFILGRELPGGGFPWVGTTASPDVTAMALQALAPYQAEEAVAAVVARALTALSNTQAANGGFAWEAEGEACEGVAQVVIALAAHEIDPAADARFAKSGGNAMDALLRFQKANGSFNHVAAGTGSIQMATEQAACALAAYDRLINGEAALYDMSSSALKSQVAAAKAVKLPALGAAAGGLVEADYTPESWAALQTAIAQAIAAANAAMTMAEINAVAVPSTGGLVTKLAAAKSARIAAIQAVTAGLKQSDYTAESWSALQTAITQAVGAVNAAATVAAVNAIALPSASLLVRNPKWWETPPLPAFLHWILRIFLFGWIWMR